MSWTKWMGLSFGGLVVAGLGIAAYGSARWTGATRALLSRLDAARLPASPSQYDARELAGLPSPVQRYFLAVLTDGQPIITAATAEHTGTFRMNLNHEQWKPFRSQQHVVTRRPGFVWDGRIAIMPGIEVHVHDAYLAGEGILHPAILGLFTLIDLRGPGDIAQGELMRFFAEAAWYPTALLPSQGVRWDAVDDRCARATLVDDKLSQSMLFSFNDDGLIGAIRAEARGRMVGNTIVMSPWEGRWSNYQERNGMRVPFIGEVSWLLPEGRKPYWRGTIVSLAYEFAEH